MAPVNPPVQELQAPSFVGLSKAISPYDLKADRSKEIAMTGIGSALAGTVKGIDEAWKYDVENQAYTEAEGLASSYKMSLLDSAGNQPEAPVGQPQGTANTGQKPMSLLPGDDAMASGDVPGEIDKGVQTAGRAHTALTSNKISETQYYMALDSMASRLRAKYPMYRDYIDRSIAQATGISHTANELIRSVIADQNRAGDVAKIERQEIMTSFKKLNDEGYPGANQWMDRYAAGGMDNSQAREFINKANARHYQLNTLKEGAEAGKYVGEMEKQQFQPVANQRAQDLHAATMEGIYTAHGSISPKQMFEDVQAYVNKKKDISAETFQNWSQQLGVTMEAAVAQYKREMAVHKAGERSVEDKVGGPEEIDKIARAAFKPMADFRDAISKGDYPLAMTIANNLKAKEMDYTKQVFNDKDVERASLLNKFMKERFGDFPWVQNKLLDQLMPKGLPDQINAQVQKMQNEVRTQITKDEQGKPKTVSEGLDELRMRFKGAPGAKEAYREYLKVIQDMGDPNTPKEVVKNIADGMFTQGNNNFLEDRNFKRDYYDWNLKKQINGKFSVYTAALSPNNIKNVMALGDDVTADNMRVWAEHQFAHELFPGELKELSKWQNIPGLKFTYNPEDQYEPLKIEGKIDPVTAGAGYGLQGPADYERSIRDSVSNLNIGLRVLGNVEKATRGDREAFILRAMSQQGVDLTNLQGLPERLVKAMRMSREGPETMEEAQKPKKAKTQDRMPQ